MLVLWGMPVDDAKNGDGLLDSDDGTHDIVSCLGAKQHTAALEEEKHWGIFRVVGAWCVSTDWDCVTATRRYLNCLDCNSSVESRRYHQTTRRLFSSLVAYRTEDIRFRRVIAVISISGCTWIFLRKDTPLLAWNAVPGKVHADAFGF
jgi:hypothetical protein